jgi:hypothetical protein
VKGNNNMIAPFAPTFSICSQCGLSHPPVSPGEKCPMAKEKTSSGKVIDYNPFLGSIRNILSSQIEMKKIKDPEKIFGELTISITKFLEVYKE